MTYVSHDLLGAVVSKRDDRASHWPLEDVVEARIVAVWLGDDDRLRYAAKDAKGNVGQIEAHHARLGPYVRMPRWEIVCPKCSHSLGPIFVSKCDGLTCPKCFDRFNWEAKTPSFSRFRCLRCDYVDAPPAGGDAGSVPLWNECGTGTTWGLKQCPKCSVFYAYPRSPGGLVPDAVGRSKDTVILKDMAEIVAFT